MEKDILTYKDIFKETKKYLRNLLVYYSLCEKDNFNAIFRMNLLDEAFNEKCSLYIQEFSENIEDGLEIRGIEVVLESFKKGIRSLVPGSGKIENKTRYYQLGFTHNKGFTMDKENAYKF